MARWERSIWILMVLASASVAHAQSARGYLGILGEDVPQGDAKGAVIRDVAPGGPAEKAGIKVGDQVIGIGDQVITSFEDLRVRMGTFKPGDKLDLKLLRDGKELTIAVTLEDPPAPSRNPTQRGFRFRIPSNGEPGDDIPVPDVNDMLEPQPMVGIQLQSIDDALRERFKLGDVKGVLVSEVVPNGPAAKAGIQAEDVITAIDDKPLTNPAEMRDLIQTKKKGDIVTFTLSRAGETMEKKVVIDERVVMNFPFEPGDLGGMLEPRFEGLQRRLTELENRLQQGSQEGLEALGERLRQLELKAQEKTRERVDVLEKKIAELEEKVENSGSEAVQRLERAVQELSRKVDALASPK